MIEYAEYNGWTNRETWMVNLWLTNDEGFYKVMCVISRNHEASRQADALKALVRDSFELMGIETSLWRDLVGVSLARVNWQEIIDCNKE